MNFIIRRVIIFITGLAITSFAQVADVNTNGHSQYTRNDCSDGKPADVAFILDASNSIWVVDFWRQLNFVQQMVEEFKIGRHNIQIALITYADYPVVQFHFNYYHRKSDILDAIENVRQNGGSQTDTAEAIRYLRERVFSLEGGARPNVTRLGVVITDGLSNHPMRTALEAQKARDEGIHMFAVGVGQGLDRLELNAIGSLPSEYYTFTVQNFQGLENIRRLLAIKACTVTEPPIVTKATTTTATTTTTTTTTTRLPTESSTEASSDENEWVYDEASRRWILRKRRSNGSKGEVIGYWVYDDQGRAEWIQLQDNPHEDTDSYWAQYGRKGFMEQKGKEETGLDVCRPKSKVDLVFIVDTKNETASRAHKKKMWTFVRDIISQIDMSRDQVYVQFVQSSSRYDELMDRHSPTSNRNRITDKSRLLSAIDNIAWSHRTTAELFEEMLEKFSKSSEENRDTTKYEASSWMGKNTLLNDGEKEDTNSGSTNRKRVGVYVTDGHSEDFEKTVSAAQDVRLNHAVEMFTVGLGGSVNPTELTAIASCVEKGHVFLQKSHTGIDEHTDVHYMKKRLASALCKL